MSNEFILIVAWKPVSRQYGWQPTPARISKVKISTTMLLDSHSIVNGIYDLRLIESKKSMATLIIKGDNSKNLLAFECDGGAAKSKELATGDKIMITALWSYKNKILFVGDSKIVVRDMDQGGKDIWSYDTAYSSEGFGLSNWSCSSRYMSAVNSRVSIIVASKIDSNQELLYFDIAGLTYSPPVSPKPEIIARNVSFAAVDDRNTTMVYWIDDKKIGISCDKKEPISIVDVACLDESERLMLNCLQPTSCWLLAAGSIQGPSSMTNDFFLLSKKTMSYKHRLSLPCTNGKYQPNKMAAAIINKVSVVSIANMFSYMTVIVISNNKLYLIAEKCDTNGDNESSQNYGIAATAWKNRVDVYVAGCSETFLNRITIKMP